MLDHIFVAYFIESLKCTGKVCCIAYVRFLGVKKKKKKRNERLRCMSTISLASSEKVGKRLNRAFVAHLRLAWE